MGRVTRDMTVWSNQAGTVHHALHWAVSHYFHLTWLWLGLRGTVGASRLILLRSGGGSELSIESPALVKQVDGWWERGRKLNTVCYSLWATTFHPTTTLSPSTIQKNAFKITDNIQNVVKNKYQESGMSGVIWEGGGTVNKQQAMVWRFWHWRMAVV